MARKKRHKKRKSTGVSTVDVYQTVRRTWAINPATKVSATEKGYKRSRSRREARQLAEKEGADA